MQMEIFVILSKNYKKTASEGKIKARPKSKNLKEVTKKKKSYEEPYVLAYCLLEICYKSYSMGAIIYC